MVAVVAVVVLAGAAVGCSSDDRSANAFCARLSEATGPGGAEVVFLTGDPAQLPAITAELQELFDRAPDEIATTTATLVDFFEAYQRAPRGDRRDLLADRQAELDQASREFSSYALNECGLILHRAVPTPIAGSDPGIEASE